MTLKEQLNGLRHHAYAVIGGQGAKADLIDLLESEYDINIRGNPDFYDRKYENFTIDDARVLREDHSTRPIQNSGTKIFVLFMERITVEAQNSLLKLLEEPAEYAHFFLIIPKENLLLPTVRSRLLMVHADRSTEASDTDVAKDVAEKFLSSSVPKRMEIVKSITDKLSKEDFSRQYIVDFIGALQSLIYTNGGVRKFNAALEALDTADKYLNDRSPSIKMLLEYIALNI